MPLFRDELCENFAMIFKLATLERFAFPFKLLSHMFLFMYSRTIARSRWLHWYFRRAKNRADFPDEKFSIEKLNKVLKLKIFKAINQII